MCVCIPKLAPPTCHAFRFFLAVRKTCLFSTRTTFKFLWRLPKETLGVYVRVVCMCTQKCNRFLFLFRHHYHLFTFCRQHLAANYSDVSYAPKEVTFPELQSSQCEHVC